MRLVTAEERDHDEIIQVWEDSVRATHDFLAEADIRFFKGLIRDEYLAAVSLYCLKDDAGTIHGFLGMSGRSVEMLFLAPQSLGQGLGKMLMRFALDELGADRVDVNEQNPSALGFYEHMGFRVVGRSPADGVGKPYPILHLELARSSA